MKKGIRKRRALTYNDELVVHVKKDMILTVDGKKVISALFVQKLIRKEDLKLYQRYTASKSKGAYACSEFYGVEWLDLNKPMKDMHSSVIISFTQDSENYLEVAK